MTLALPDEMTPAIREALGTMVFHSGPMAEIFRCGGEAIPRKIEHEQAAVLWKMLRLAIQFPDDWQSRYSTLMADAMERAEAPT